MTESQELRKWRLPASALALTVLGSSVLTGCKPVPEYTGTVYIVETSERIAVIAQCDSMDTCGQTTVDATIPEGAEPSSLQTGEVVTVVDGTVVMPAH